MKKDRLIALTDAVLAIIMTILILELEKPTTPSLQAFWDLRQNFFAYFKCLRKKYNLKQSDLGNAGQVSQVEKGGI